MGTTYTFGSGATTLVGTASGLNGDTINNYLPGDHIQITDSNLNTGNINLSISGNTLSYNGGSLTITNMGPGRDVVRNLPNGGVDIELQQAAHNDFNGDGRSDVLWRNDSGALSDWLGTAAGGFAVNDAHAYSTVTTDWVVAGTGDFNGDGSVDLLWRNTNTGQVSDWLANSTGGFVNNDAHAFTSVPTDWKVVGTGDFNGDGISDVLWRNSVTGEVSDWLGNSSGGFVINDANAAVNVPADWVVAGTGDFNNDGSTDILWRNTATGQVSDWLGTSSGGFTVNDSHAMTSAPNDWKIVATGDFNGDGVSDILWRNSTTGVVSDWLGNSSGGFTVNDAHAATYVSADWHIVGVGDFNGDAVDDILWRNSNGQLSDWLGNSSGGFAVNDAHASTFVPTNWHVQDQLVWGN